MSTPEKKANRVYNKLNNETQRRVWRGLLELAGGSPNGAVEKKALLFDPPARDLKSVPKSLGFRRSIDEGPIAELCNAVSQVVLSPAITAKGPKFTTPLLKNAHRFAVLNSFHKHVFRASLERGVEALVVVEAFRANRVFEPNRGYQLAHRIGPKKKNGVDIPIAEEAWAAIERSCRDRVASLLPKPDEDFRPSSALRKAKTVDELVDLIVAHLVAKRLGV